MFVTLFKKVYVIAFDKVFFFLVVVFGTFMNIYSRLILERNDKFHRVYKPLRILGGVKGCERNQEN